MIFDPSTREVATRLRCLLASMDIHMSKRWDAQRGWIEISVALGLPSTKGRSVTEIAEEMGVTKQAISKGSTTFLRMSQLPPAYGLKSVEARLTYQRTNGVTRAD
jgi:hypothetical protein